MSQIMRDPIFIAIFIFTIFLFAKFFKKNHLAIESNRITSTDISDSKITFTKNNTISTITYDKETSTALINIAGTQQNLRACWGNIGCWVHEDCQEIHHEGSFVFKKYTEYKSTYNLKLAVKFHGLDVHSADFENRGISSSLNAMEFELGELASKDIVEKYRKKIDEWQANHEIWLKNKGNELRSSFEDFENRRIVDKQLELKAKISTTLNLELNEDNSDCFLLTEIDGGNSGEYPVFSKRLFAYKNLNLSKYHIKLLKKYGRPGTEYVNHDWMQICNEMPDFISTNENGIQLLHKGDAKNSYYFKIPFKMLGKIDRKSFAYWYCNRALSPYDQVEMDLKVGKLIAL